MNTEVWNALVAQRNMEYAMNKYMREHIDEKYRKK